MKICCVLVTYNRLEKLKKVLSSYSYQTIKPDTLVVVNNNSTDGTKDVLENWSRISEGFEKIVINLSENTGGSGGFYAGIEYALSKDFDWVYLGDDDAYLNKDLLERFIERKEVLDPNVGAIAGQVDSPNGVMFFHRRHIKKSLLFFKEVATVQKEYNEDSFKIDLFSFVGVFIRKSAIEKVGLPKKDYFIWYDDTEYSYRISKKFKCVCVPSIKTYHDCIESEIAFCWKSYYGYRNKLDMLKRNAGFIKYHAFKTMLYFSSILDSLKRKIKGKVKRLAIKDARKGQFGKNPLFLPGKDIIL